MGLFFMGNNDNDRAVELTHGPLTPDVFSYITVTVASAVAAGLAARATRRPPRPSSSMSGPPVCLLAPVAACWSVSRSRSMPTTTSPSS